MREREFLVALCDTLTETFGREFIPETWRDGCISVFLAGGGGRVRSYVDGSGACEIPIEIKMRSVVRCEVDRLRVLDVLSEVESKDITMDDVGATLCSAGSAKKTKTYENGSEEYTAPFVLKYFTYGAGDASRKEKNGIYRKK